MNPKKENDISCEPETRVCSPHKSKATENSFLSKKNSNNIKVKLIYYFDALCGWCYGFSSTMEKVEQVYGDQVEIKVISGGLFLGNRAGGVNEVAPHIKAGAYRSVEMQTGVKFGKPFLDDVFGEGKMTLNSMPPTIALCIVKEKFPEQELKFASTILKAVYFDGLDPIDVNGLAGYAEKIGFDKAEFILFMNDSKFQKLAEQEFEIFHNSPYSAMPAIVLEKGGKQFPITRGYVGFENLKTKLDLLLDK